MLLRVGDNLEAYLSQFFCQSNVMRKCVVALILILSLILIMKKTYILRAYLEIVQVEMKMNQSGKNRSHSFARYFAIFCLPAAQALSQFFSCVGGCVFIVAY